MALEHTHGPGRVADAAPAHPMRGRGVPACAAGNLHHAHPAEAVWLHAALPEVRPDGAGGRHAHTMHTDECRARVVTEARTDPAHAGRLENQEEKRLKWMEGFHEKQVLQEELGPFADQPAPPPGLETPDAAGQEAALDLDIPAADGEDAGLLDQVMRGGPLPPRGGRRRAAAVSNAKPKLQTRTSRRTYQDVCPRCPGSAGTTTARRRTSRHTYRGACRPMTRPPQQVTW